MKTMYTTKKLALVVISTTLFSCGDPQKNEIEAQIQEPDTATVEISKEEIQTLITSFPTPVETAMIIKGANHDLSTDELLPVGNEENFISSYEQALALGGYAADMGFLNMYQRMDALPEYLKMVRAMAKGLDLLSFFDFENLLELSKNADNMDALILSTTESFNQMEDYLREQGRDEISLMIVYGTWLEGAYLYAKIANESGSEDMKSRIIEQKDFVLKLSDLFNKSSDQYFQGLSKDFNSLKGLYEKVSIEHIYKEPTMEEVDGQLVFIDNSETIVNATPADLDNIIKETINLRNKLLK